MMGEGSLENQLVKGGEVVEREHPRYRALPETTVGAISRDRRVQIKGPHTDTEIQVRIQRPHTDTEIQVRIQEVMEEGGTIQEI